MIVEERKPKKSFSPTLASKLIVRTLMNKRDEEDLPMTTQDYQFNYIKPHDNHIMRVKRFRQERS